MKKTFCRYVNLLMACLVLLSSTGFGLIEHTCLMRGKKVSMTINRSEKATCAVHQKKSFSVSRQSSIGPVIKRSDCCKEEQRYENVDFSSSLTQLVAKFIKSTTDLAGAAAATLVSWLVETLFEVETESVAFRVDSPPLPYGRSLLSFVQSFLL
ncbi:HYC_CC_PP family protein [Larkinella sp. VNQ87]|uniref:HYC_CC_PP family protein n=1 Tax=Larkinella sp. VNQ87 TaxID=3400921 RepID=UPI003BFFF20F